MSVKIITEGAQLKLIQRLACMQEAAEGLQSDLEVLQAARDECCEGFDNVISMRGTAVTLDGENVTMG